jgi:Ca2+-binding RTX toxin-like protein
VQARSPGGTDGPVLEHTFTVAAGPWVSVQSQPRMVLPVGTAAFSWSAPGAVCFRYGLDDDDLVDNPCGGNFTSGVFTGLADGQHTLRVQARSPGGTDGPAVTVHFTVETKAPQTTITSGPPTFTSNTSATITFAADETATFECRVDGGLWETCGTPFLHTFAPGEHDHTFEVRAKDLAGNVDATPATHAWRIDTVAPTVVDLAGPTGIVTVPDATFTYSADESPVTFECRVDGGLWETCGTSRSFTGLPDGLHTFEVRATDQAGNTGEAEGRQWTVATDEPDTMITSAPAGTVSSASASIEFTSDEPDADFECRLDGGAWLEGCTSPRPLNGLADGTHTFEVRAVLHGALRDQTPASATWTVDTLAPIVTITSGPSGTVGAGPVTFHYEADDSGATFQCRLDGGAWEPCPGGQRTYSGLGDGTHLFEVRATDMAGNVGPADSQEWSVDAVAPVVTITSGPTGTVATNAAELMFTVDDPAAPAECRLDGGAWELCPGGEKTYSGLGDGGHAFEVRATDPAGNTGSDGPWSWTIDTTPPDVTITAGPTGPVASVDAVFEFASTDPTATFECSLDGGAFEPCPAGTKGYTSLAQGDHTFAVRAVDPVGNTSAPATREWSVDTVPPDVVITAGPSGVVTSPTATFEFVSSETTGVTFVCSLDGVAAPCESGETYSGLANGEHTFTVRAQDALGNTSEPAVRTWTIETVESDTFITSAPPALTNNPDATFTFGADRDQATFECSLGGAAWAACPTPYELPDLADGQYTLEVRAVLEGLADQSPAKATWMVDTVAPIATITSAPRPVETAAGSVFEFIVDDVTALLECSVDGSAWEPCGAPAYSASHLPDGPHTFAVRARDLAANIGPADSRTWTIDGTPPVVDITSGPSGTATSRDATFEFVVDDPDADAECRLDGGPWAPCTDSYSTAGLADGPHSFDVRATDGAGNVGAEGRLWFVDGTPPVVTITGGPSGPVTTKDASFTFTVDDPAATLTCRLDGVVVTPCSTPRNFSDLAEGEHVLVIDAVDIPGNRGAATRTWTVDTVAPTVTITSGPDGTVGSPDATFEFTADEPATFECRIDGGAWEECNSGQEQYADLPEGMHTFEVRATDLAGHPSTIATRGWLIELVGDPLLEVTVSAEAGGQPITTTGLGDDFSYRVDISNVGTAAAEGVAVDIPLSSDVRVVAGGLPAGCTATSVNGPVRCTLPVLGTGATTTYLIGVEAVFGCTIWGFSGPDVLDGTTGNDVICGGGGGDRIRGRGGMDVVYGYGNRVGGLLADDRVSTIAAATYGPGERLATAPAPFTVLIGGEDGADDIVTGNQADQVFAEEGDDEVDAGGGDDVVGGGEGSDELRTGTGNDTVTGGGGTDTITTADGDDVIDGGDGDDIINAGSGANTVHGGAGGDWITTGTGADKVYGDDGDDTINAGSGTNTVEGGNEDDDIVTGGGIDTVSGGAGNDTIRTTGGVDVVAGDDGADTVDAGSGDNAVQGGAGNDSITTGTGNDDVDGGDGDDTINAGSGDNTVLGGAGNDQITTGNGADTVTGGTGDDTIASGGGLDTIDAGDGHDSVSAPSGNNQVQGGPGDDIITTGSGDDTVDGGSGDDAIWDSRGTNSLVGGDGNDSITGGTGVDTIDGGPGDDTVNSGSGADTVQGGDGDDVVDGGNANDTLRGDAGRDTLLGGRGSDTIYGGDEAELIPGTDEGDLWLDGGPGDDTIFGNDGNDHLDGGPGRDTLWGNVGNDTLFGGSGNDVELHGGEGDDVVHGGDGNDRVDGDPGDDELYGDSGNDDLNGDAGDDWMQGGPGEDVLLGHADQDFMLGGDGHDYLNGGDGHDYLNGQLGRDVLRGSAGDDELDGGGTPLTRRQSPGDHWNRLYGDGDTDICHVGPGIGTDETNYRDASCELRDIGVAAPGAGWLNGVRSRLDRVRTNGDFPG